MKVGDHPDLTKVAELLSEGDIVIRWSSNEDAEHRQVTRVDDQRLYTEGGGSYTPNQVILVSFPE